MQDRNTPFWDFTIVLLLSLAHLVCATFVGYYTWGANIWSILPVWIMICSFALLMILALPPIAERLSHAIVRIWCSISRIALGKSSSFFLILALGLLVVATYSIRSRVLLYGDGYIAVANTLHPWTSIFSGIHEWLKPLSIVIYKLNYSITSAIFGASPETSFAICSSIGGVVGWLGLYRLICSVDTKGDSRSFLFAATCTSGAVLLFCGHIELYVWAAAAYLWFLAKCHTPQSGGQLLSASLAGVFTVALNLMLLPAVATLLLILLRDRWKSLNSIIKPGRLLVAVACASLLGAIALQWYGVEYGTVPLIPRPDNPYAILSWSHLSDMLNVLLFAAPLVVIVLLRSDVLRTMSSHWILVSAFTVPFLVALWIDVDAGAVRDWDLLSLFGLPLSLFLAIALSRGRTMKSLQRGAFVFACLALFLLAPYLYERIDTTSSVNRLHTIISNDPHYQQNYDHGFRNLSWGALLNDRVGRPDLAEFYIRRRVEAEPTCAISRSNLAVLLFQQKQRDSAEVYFRAAYVLEPTNEAYRARLQEVLLLQGDWEDAAKLVPDNAIGDSIQILALRRCGLELLSVGNNHSALTCFRISDSLNENSWMDRLAIAVACSRIGWIDSTRVYCLQAEALCPDSEKCNLYQSTVNNLMDVNQVALARELFERYLALCKGTIDEETARRMAGR